MKKSRRLLGMILSLIMVIGLINGIPMNVRAEGEHTHEGYTAWDSTTTLPDTPGSYYLNNDVTLSETWIVPEGEMNLCLNGHGIRMIGDTGSVIDIQTSATLNLFDCDNSSTHYVTLTEWRGMAVGDSGTESFDNDTGNGVVKVVGGYITGGTGSSFGTYFNGGAICVRDNGILNMYGGTIVGNKSNRYGAGIYTLGQFTMDGGVITYNQGDGSGGVSIAKGQFTLKQGVIQNNRAKYGAGIYIGYDSSGTVFNMEGGSVINNEAIYPEANAVVGGGGVFCSGNNSVCNISGGTIANNTVQGKGGGIYMEHGTAVIENCLITNNKAIKSTSHPDSTGHGGGLASGGNGSPKVTLRNVEISDNYAEASGGGFYVKADNTTSLESGVLIHDNNAEANGGGIGIETSTSYVDVIISNGVRIYNNKANNGGGVYVSGNRSKLTMSGVEISDNTAIVSGGGVYYAGGAYASRRNNYNSSMEISGGEISRNLAVQNGGGVFYSGYSYNYNDTTRESYFTISGSANISGNSGGCTNDEGELSNGIDNNVYFAYHYTGSGSNNIPSIMTFGDSLTSDASIGITPELADGKYTVPYTFTRGLSETGGITTEEDTRNIFFSDNPSYGIGYNEGEAQLIQKYAVTYDPNGAESGEAPTDSNSPYYLDEEVTVLGNTGDLSKTDGTSFGGWNTLEDGTGTTYKPGDTFNIDDDITLYAKWILHTHEWSYTADGAVITATCANTDEKHEGDTDIELTIVAPSHMTYGDGNSTSATLDGLDDFNDATTNSISSDDISYYKATKDGNTYTKTGEALSGAPEEVGDYIAEIKLENVKTSEDGTGDVTAFVTYTIEKADVTDVAVYMNDYTYGDEPSVPYDDCTSGGTVEYYFNTTDSNEGGIPWTPLDPPTLDAGTYYMYAIITGTENYNGCTTETTEFEVGKRPVTVYGITAEDKTYDGTTDAVLSGENATIEGIIDGDDLTVTATGEFRTANAGDNRTVDINSIELGGDDVDNYELADMGQQETTAAEIFPKSIEDADVTLDEISFTYDGDEKTVAVTSVVVDNVDLTADTDYEIDNDLSDISATVVGNYSVTVNGIGNYKDSVTVDWEITEADMDVSAANVEEVYDGSDYGIDVVVTDPADDYTITYGLEEDTYDLNDNPTFTDVCELTVYYKVTADNYNDYTGSATVKITERPVTITGVTASGKTYDGTTDATISGTAVIDNMVEGDDVSVDTTNATAKFADANAGNGKTVTFSGFALTGEKASNYTLTAQPEATTADIEPADSVIETPPEAKDGLSYTGEEQELVTAGSGVTGGDLVYAVTDTDEAPEEGYSPDVPKMTDVGTYYVWYKVVSDDNHNDTDPVSVKVDISEADKSDLNAAIKDAKDYADDISGNDNYKDVADKLNNAIADAEAVAGKEDATPEEIGNAVKELKEALQAAKDSVKAVDDKNAADAVKEKINKLKDADKITLSDKAAVEEARAAYEALTEDQKALIGNNTLKKLVDDEKAIEALEKAEEEKKKEEEGSDDTSDNKKSNPNYSNEWVNGQWYDANGNADYKPQGSWHLNSTGWWYEDEAHWYAKNCWQKIDFKWYYFDGSGYMLTNQYCGSWDPYSEGNWWVGADGAWDGSAPAKWRLSGSRWYIIDDTGWYAKDSWYRIREKWYYFDSEGYMATSQYIGDCWVGGDGAWQE